MYWLEFQNVIEVCDWIKLKKKKKRHFIKDRPICKSKITNFNFKFKEYKLLYCPIINK